MSDDPSHYLLRMPRHDVAADCPLAVTCHVVSGDRRSGLEVVEAAVAIELVNLSRSGLQLRSPCDFSRGDRLLFQFSACEFDFQFAQEGVVRWQRKESDTSWLSGCQFLEELSWEVMGELFLADILQAPVASVKGQESEDAPA